MPRAQASAAAASRLRNAVVVAATLAASMQRASSLATWWNRWSRDRRLAVSAVMAALSDSQPLVTGPRVTGSARAAGRAPPGDTKGKLDAIPPPGPTRRLIHHGAPLGLNGQ